MATDGTIGPVDPAIVLLIVVTGGVVDDDVDHIGKKSINPAAAAAAAAEWIPLGVDDDMVVEDVPVDDVETTIVGLTLGCWLVRPCVNVGEKLTVVSAGTNSDDDGGCIGYVAAPTVNDSGGPNELETEKGTPLLLLLGGVDVVDVVVAPTGRMTPSI